MRTGKRTILTILAWIGWGATVTILGAIYFEAGIVLEKWLFFSRLFALFGLVSAVLTLGIWFESARTRNIIPVEEAYRLGVEFGAKWSTNSAMTQELDQFLRQPVSTEGQQESPPIKWPLR